MKRGGAEARVVVAEVESDGRRDGRVVPSGEDVHFGAAEVIDRVDEAVATPLARDVSQNAHVHR